MEKADIVAERKNLCIALGGNPNAGKSTIFNALTGGHQHVGNWPGVTVEKREGRFRYKDYEVKVVDLPGTYSLTAYSLDEKVARDFLVKGKPDVTVAVTDSTNLERNLYLTVVLLELGANVILDLNMTDILENKKIAVDIEKMSKILKSPVVRTSANKKIGIEQLKEAIIQNSKRKVEPYRIDYGEDIEREIEKIERELENVETDYPKRFVATRLLEGDTEIMDIVKKLGGESAIEISKEAHLKLEKKFGYDTETMMIERRYAFIEGIVKECVHRQHIPHTLRERFSTSDKIDRIVTNKFLGIPIFLVIMWLTFQLTFTIGGWLADYIDMFFGWLAEVSTIWLASIGAPQWLDSLIGNGIISGVGTVLVFLPNIMLLFFAIAILEDSGYMARAAFVMDRLMHAMGLHGKSFIPMLIGFGCNVPAIMATRTLSSRKDRLLTILVNPFMSCSARLPIYILFTSIFFTRHQGSIVFSLYLLGIIVAVVSARVFKSLFFKHEVAPLVMELPPYRMPTIKGILIHMWERSSAFLKKAGTIIVAGVIVIWFLASFPTSAEYASQQTLIGHLGQFLAPLFKPAGFGFWQAGVALFFGIIAKETVVGTMGALFGGEEKLAVVLPHFFTPLSAYAFMVMSLLYIPCIASIGAIYRETNWKWTTFAVAYSLLIGWTFAVMFYQIGSTFI